MFNLPKKLIGAAGGVAASSFLADTMMHAITPGPGQGAEGLILKKGTTGNGQNGFHEFTTCTLGLPDLAASHRKTSSASKIGTHEHAQRQPAEKPATAKSVLQKFPDLEDDQVLEPRSSSPSSTSEGEAENGGSALSRSAPQIGARACDERGQHLKGQVSPRFPVRIRARKWTLPPQPLCHEAGEEWKKGAPPLPLASSILWREIEDRMKKDIAARKKRRAKARRAVKRRNANSLNRHVKRYLSGTRDADVERYLATRLRTASP